jgi:hypothetical protein
MRGGQAVAKGFVMPRRLKLRRLLWLNVAKRIFARIDKSGVGSSTLIELIVAADAHQLKFDLGGYKHEVEAEAEMAR